MPVLSRNSVSRSIRGGIGGEVGGIAGWQNLPPAKKGSPYNTPFLHTSLAGTHRFLGGIYKREFIS